MAQYRGFFWLTMFLSIYCLWEGWTSLSLDMWLKTWIQHNNFNLVTVEISLGCRRILIYQNIPALDWFVVCLQCTPTSTIWSSFVWKLFQSFCVLIRRRHPLEIRCTLKDDKNAKLIGNETLLFMLMSKILGSSGRSKGTYCITIFGHFRFFDIAVIKNNGLNTFDFKDHLLKPVALHSGLKLINFQNFWVSGCTAAWN